MVTLYGIPNCDTVKKARQWLNNHNIAHQFHDFRKNGLEKTTVGQWLDAVGTETLINRRGTTWRSLPEHERNTLSKADTIRLLLSYPTLIKRPVIDTGTEYLVGFDTTRYQEALLSEDTTSA